jgi:hypothetical protein
VPVADPTTKVRVASRITIVAIVVSKERPEALIDYRPRLE